MSAGPLSAFNSPNIPARNPTIPETFDAENATLAASGSGGSSEVVPSKFSKEHLLYDDLAPEDSYQDGVYWVSTGVFRLRRRRRRSCSDGLLWR
jgi:hypothetical protein